MTITEQVREARRVSVKLASVDVKERDRVLNSIADSLVDNTQYILSENKKDLEAAEKNALTDSLYKRLVLSEKKIADIAEGVRSVSALDDPLGKLQMHRELDSGLELYRLSVPLGVVGVIFESRPDALVQISSLFIKSGNAGILKGGKEAIHTNRALFSLIKEELEKDQALLKNSLHLAESREDIKEILKLDEYIDLMIPRGGNELVKFIKENTKIPVMGHTDGICHLYVDSQADMEKALVLTYDSKCQYPAVCNAIETLLVNREIAGEFLPAMQEKLKEVELRGCEETCQIISVKKANSEDWDTEYNDYILSVKVVGDVQEAIDHINAHGSGHTDCIVTEDQEKAELFMNTVDAASVYCNCSTRFADGFRYGFGAEVGISTNKIHSRGPVGLEGLTIYKYRLIGNGHIVADYAENRKSFTHKDLI